MLINDIKWYLTGAVSNGGAQSDPNLSFGNYRSSTEVVLDPIDNNAFDDTSNAERITGDTEYRCICIKNTNATDSILNAKIWLEGDTGNPEDDISFAIEVPTGGDENGNAQTIIDETTSPVVGAGNVGNWSDVTTKLTGEGLTLGTHDANLDAGEIVFVWLRRIIAAGALCSLEENFSIRIEGEV